MTDQTPPKQQPSPAKQPSKQPSQRERKEAAAKTWRLLGWLLAALIATYAAYAFPLPWKVLSPIFGIAGIVIAILIFRRGSTPGTSMWVPTGAAIGLLGCLFFGGMAGWQTIFWGPTAEFETCMDHAITVEAVSSCEANYSEALGVPSAPSDADPSESADPSAESAESADPTASDASDEPSE